MRRPIALVLSCLALLLVAMQASAEYGDIKFSRRTKGTADVPEAVFPHFAHRMQFHCYVCHESIFEMRAGANPVSMDAIQAGKFCGRCHDGKTAFQATFDTCPRCHRP
jgi:c(7)-type cytochrome triheme protein